MAYGMANQSRLVLQPECLHQSGTVFLHCPLADVEPCGNLGVCIPLSRELQHLALPGSKGFVRLERAGLVPVNVGVDGNLSHWRTEKTFARRTFPDGAMEERTCRWMTRFLTSAR